MQRMTRAPEPPEAMSDEALREVGRVILAITAERVTAANYIEAATSGSKAASGADAPVSPVSSSSGPGYASSASCSSRLA